MDFDEGKGGAFAPGAGKMVYQKAGYCGNIHELSAAEYQVLQKERIRCRERKSPFLLCYNFSVLCSHRKEVENGVTWMQEKVDACIPDSGVACGHPGRMWKERR